MAANTKRKAAEADYQPPAPAGCAAHEHSSWLPDLPLPWLRELRVRRIELARAWARSVDAIGAARDEQAQLEGSHRQAVRDAIASGAPAPARSPELDPAIREAHVSIAVEDAQTARDDLSEYVLACLAELRGSRADLAPFSGRSARICSARSADARPTRRHRPDRADALVIALWAAQQAAGWAARAHEDHWVPEHPLAAGAEGRKYGTDGLMGDILGKVW